MPQWSRDRRADRAKFPDERCSARCPRADAPLLLRHDHHVVWINSRPALLLTYRWAESAPEEWPDALPFDVSFTYAPGHPPAPPDVQRIVDSLSFAPHEPI